MLDPIIKEWKYTCDCFMRHQLPTLFRTGSNDNHVDAVIIIYRIINKK